MSDHLLRWLTILKALPTDWRYAAVAGVEPDVDPELLEEELGNFLPRLEMVYR